MKERDEALAQPFPLWEQLKLLIEDGKNDARVGGQIASTARKQIERQIGRSVVAKNNFLKTKEAKKLNN
ncbi:MAG: hypothetical protein WC752_02955 [Patescibacteria group bacterium]|jgi:hypothetical protein